LRMGYPVHDGTRGRFLKLSSMPIVTPNRERDEWNR
jgi:hypothetical protein